MGSIARCARLACRLRCRALPFLVASSCLALAAHRALPSLLWQVQVPGLQQSSWTFNKLSYTGGHAGGFNPHECDHYFPAPPLPASGDGDRGGGLRTTAVGLGLTAAAQHRLSSPAAALQPRRLAEHETFLDVLAACVAELRATRDGRRAELDTCVFTPLRAYEEWTHWASQGVS